MKTGDFFLNKYGTLCMYVGITSGWHEYIVVLTQKRYYDDDTSFLSKYNVLNDSQVVTYLRNLKI